VKQFIEKSTSDIEREKVVEALAKITRIDKKDEEVLILSIAKGLIA